MNSDEVLIIERRYNVRVLYMVAGGERTVIFQHSDLGLVLAKKRDVWRVLQSLFKEVDCS